MIYTEELIKMKNALEQNIKEDGEKALKWVTENCVELLEELIIRRQREQDTIKGLLD